MNHDNPISRRREEEELSRVLTVSLMHLQHCRYVCCLHKTNTIYEPL
jgi:hypothetical protein